MNQETRSNKARRTWSAEIKLHIVQEGRSGSATVSSIYAQHDIPPPLFYPWERTAD